MHIKGFRCTTTIETITNNTSLLGIILLEFKNIGLCYEKLHYVINLLHSRQRNACYLVIICFLEFLIFIKLNNLSM